MSYSVSFYKGKIIYLGSVKWKLMFDNYNLIINFLVMIVIFNRVINFYDYGNFMDLI